MDELFFALLRGFYKLDDTWVDIKTMYKESDWSIAIDGCRKALITYPRDDNAWNTHYSGDDELFHGNIVNCCIGCYAQIIQGMALWDDDGRKQEIGNLTRALRAKPPVPAQAAINAEHLLAGLISMNDASSLADEDLQEALYCGTSALRADLDALAG